MSAMAEPTRTIEFPGRRVFGTIHLRDADPEAIYPRAGHLTGWHPHGPAKGKVKVPAEAEALLAVPDAAGDLSFLDKLPPDALQGLFLGNTQVDDQALGHVARLTGLVWLDVQNQPITDDGAECFEGLTNLLWLGVHMTGITDAAFAAWGNLARLRLLDLWGCAALTDRAFAGLGCYRELRFLDAGWTQLSDLGLTAIGMLEKLERLDCFGTQVSDSGIGNLLALHQLTEIGLVDCDVSPDGVAKLAILPGLETIRLPLRTVAESNGALSRLPKLRTLAVARGEYAWAELDQRSPLLGLTRLDLSWTATGDADLTYLRDHATLAELYLSGTRLSDAAVDTLASLRALTSLDLRDTALSDEAAAALATALPECTIRR